MARTYTAVLTDTRGDVTMTLPDLPSNSRYVIHLDEVSLILADTPALAPGVRPVAVYRRVGSAVHDSDTTASADDAASSSRSAS
jgi:hypothetical protein